MEEFSPMPDSFSDITLETKEMRLQKEEVLGEVLISSDQIIRECAESECTVHQTIKLLSHTTLKSSGQYVLFPSADWILKSLAFQWNCCFV